MPAMFPLIAQSRARQRLRQARQSGDATQLQQAIDGAVREGTSVDTMKRLLKQAGVKDDEAQALVDKTYPAAPPPPPAPARRAVTKPAPRAVPAR